MAIKGKKGKTAKEIIEEETRALNRTGFKEDDEFDPDETDSAFSGGRSEEEILIGELFAKINGKGFYLRLEKETPSGDWEFKDRIEQNIFGKWADPVVEVVEFVRRKTRQEIEKTGRAFSFGSARYRISAAHPTGMRENLPTSVIPVDAREFEVDAPRGVNAGGSDAVELLRTMQSGALNPQETAKQYGEAIKTGMELAIKKESTDSSSSERFMQLMITQMNANATMMSGMMTAMMNNKPVTEDSATVMRNLASLAKDMFPQKAERSELETIQLYRAAGIIPPVGAEKKEDDPIQSIMKMKNLFALIQDFTGAGPAERPSITEQIIQVAGPKAADLLLAGMQLLMQKNAGPAPAPVITPVPTRVINNPPAQPNGTEAPKPEQTKTEEDEMLGRVKRFSDELYNIVMANDTTKYDYITEQLAANFGSKAENDIRSGVMNADTMVQYITMAESQVPFCTKHYVTPDMIAKLRAYVAGYVVSVINSVKAKCSNCNGIATYENRQSFEESEHGCPGGCGGTLVAMA
ncbi:MAG TPA: hypothetical protein DHV25_03160 [Candidatus Kerfeldbacteria bacterium]|nr:hypothetical protein [Candidatus Kerfeldbacteria bacterium]